MIRRVFIALLCASFFARAALAAPPASSDSEPDPAADAGEDRDRIGDGLDEEFEDWEELDDSEARAEPEADEEPADDPRDDMPPAFYDAETWPLSEIERPLALGPGMFEIRASLDASLRSGSAFDPVSLAPDVYYGLGERLSIGVVHTRFARLEPFAAEDDVQPAALGSHGAAAPATFAGDGLCVGDTCPGLYDNFGLDVRLALGAMRGPIQLRLHAGMEAARVGPLRIGGRAGVMARLRLGPVALLVDPSLRAGLIRRGEGNRDVVSLPARLQFQATPRVAIELASGVYGPLGGFRKSWRVPGSFGALVALSSSLDLGVRGGFVSIVGGTDAPAASSVRTASLVLAYRL